MFSALSGINKKNADLLGIKYQCVSSIALKNNALDIVHLYSHLVDDCNSSRVLLMPHFRER